MQLNEHGRTDELLAVSIPSGKFCNFRARLREAGGQILGVEIFACRCSSQWLLLAAARDGETDTLALLYWNILARCVTISVGDLNRSFSV